MGRIIVVANQKGGVGKTTTVVNLGAALANLGARVALIDLDPQAALTVNLGFDPYSIKPSTHELLRSTTCSLDEILRKKLTNLFLAPANVDLISAEYQLLKESERVHRLRNALLRCQTQLDFILIDTPPGLGLLTVNALVAAQELLIPVATDYLAMRGVRALLESVWLIRDRVNPDLHLLRLVPTLYREQSPHAEAVVQEMRRVFDNRVSEVVIPVDDVAAAAPAARQTVYEFQPNSRVARAYTRLAEEVKNEHK